MLRLTIPLTPEEWDEEKEEFIPSKVTTLQLEHSLVSISKWESKWHKAFLSNKDMTDEETLDYIKCMTLTQNVNPDVYEHLTADNILEIQEYIKNPMTATVFSDRKAGKPSREIITSELIYYWMSALQIPFECQKWHINRLLTLIRIHNIKNSPPKKRGERETARSYAAMNAARRKQLNTRG